MDGVLRYFAAHTVVVNLDSYTSNMQQNYYLYERDGRVTILPWDYNLAFGGFMSGSAGGVVNFPVDTPVSGVSMESRPLLNKLLEVEKYRERYHEYLMQIVEGFFESGVFENMLDSVDGKINGYVKNDPTAFHTYEQYLASLPVFAELGRLRAESVRGQLEGVIPSTSDGQSEDSSALIDASGVSLSALGSMMGGGGMGQGDRQPGDRQPGDRQPGDPQQGGQRRPPGEGFPEDWIPEGGFPEGGFPEDWIPEGGFPEGGFPEDWFPAGELPEGGFPGRGFIEGELPEGDFPGGNQFMPNQGAAGTGANSTSAAPQTITVTTYVIMISVLLAILAGSIVYVAKPGKNTV